MAAAVQGSPRTGDESSESENETEPAKIFHRKLSTKKDVKSAVGIVGKEETERSRGGRVARCISAGIMSLHSRAKFDCCRRRLAVSVISE